MGSNLVLKIIAHVFDPDWVPCTLLFLEKMLF